MAKLSNLERAFEAIDLANSADPRTTVVDGTPLPYELVYGRRMTSVLNAFAPTSTPALQIAARAQHIERWVISRTEYTMDRTGYLTWRNDQKKRHAVRAGEILERLGFSADTIKRVQFLLEKKQLKRDVETQILEDVICLVFLQFYALEFISAHQEEKVIDILQKTWGKMSEAGQRAALRVELPDTVTDLVKKALSNA